VKVRSSRLSVKISDVLEPRDISDLVQAAAKGDQRAWDEIVRRHAGLVWSVGRSFGLGQADIADVAQTAWLRLVESLGKLREPQYLARWLVTTTRRECMRMLNRQGREVPRDVVAELEETPDTNQPPVDHPLLSRESDALVRAAFEALPVRCQQLLRLLIAEPPVPYQEIAEKLKVSLGYIGPTRGRCLDMLRRLLRMES